jgi:hypothetical protein
LDDTEDINSWNSCKKASENWGGHYEQPPVTDSAAYAACTQKTLCECVLYHDRIDNRLSRALASLSMKMHAYWPFEVYSQRWSRKLYDAMAVASSPTLAARRANKRANASLVQVVLCHLFGGTCFLGMKV